MKVGILNAISPELSQVNWGGSPVDAYIRFFQSVDAPFEYAGYQVAQGQFPASPEACDAYVITGSPRGVYDDDPWIEQLAQFIRDCYAAGKKLVGICFGHQIIAQALGGRAEKSEKGWGLGLKNFSVSGSKPWLNDGPGACSLYFAHQDQVVQLPPEAELLGGNAFCPNAFYTIDERVFAIQGHPEFTRPIMEDILDKDRDHVEPTRLEAAARSLDGGEPDNRLVAGWIVSFLVAG